MFTIPFLLLCISEKLSFDYVLQFHSCYVSLKIFKFSNAKMTWVSEVNFDFGALHSVKVPRLNSCHFSLPNTTHTTSRLGNFKFIRFELILKSNLVKFDTTSLTDRWLKDKDSSWQSNRYPELFGENQPLSHCQVKTHLPCIVRWSLKILPLVEKLPESEPSPFIPPPLNTNTWQKTTT